MLCVAVYLGCALLGLRQAQAQEVQGPTIHQQASQLMREAGRALSQGKPAEILAKATRAAELLPDDARTQQRVAELLYRSGHVLESLKHFDRAIELNPELGDHNWQRGIALATAGEFEKGAAQFSDHHRVNPDDVENSAWHFLCVAKSAGLEKAQKALLPSRGDGRQPMMAILTLFRQEKTSEQFLQELDASALVGEQLQSATFYALLYLGLYHDAMGKAGEAKHYLQRSAECDISGYMHDAARVYLAYRFKDKDINAGSNGR